MSTNTFGWLLIAACIAGFWIGGVVVARLSRARAAVFLAASGTVSLLLAGAVWLEAT